MSRISNEELRRLVEGATPGQWLMETEAEPEDDFPRFYVCSPETVCDETVVATMGGALTISEARKIADAHLIALAPQLAAEVLALRKLLIEARGWVGQYAFQMSAYTVSDAVKECAQRIDAALSPAPVVDAVKQGDAQ